jgi:hypothetical protein
MVFLPGKSSIKPETYNLRGLKVPQSLDTDER